MNITDPITGRVDLVSIRSAEDLRVKAPALYRQCVEFGANAERARYLSERKAGNTKTADSDEDQIRAILAMLPKRATV